MTQIQASLVICTSRPGPELREVLLAVAEQLPAAAELILVRSQPVPASELPNRIQDALKEVRSSVTVICDERLGQSRARMTGMRTARSEIVFFLDDDTVPRPGWFDALYRAIQEPGVVGAGGPIVAIWPGGDCPRWLPSRLKVYFSERRSDGSEPFPFGGNMVLRRSQAVAAGGFPEGLGHKGSRMGVHEERALWLRLSQFGHRIVDVPDAVVNHLIRPGQATRRWVLARAWRTGRSDALLDQHRGEVRALQPFLEMVGSVGRVHMRTLRRPLMIGLDRVLRTSGYLWESLRSRGSAR